MYYYALDPDGVLKDTKFILVRVECPYVQFVVAACIISTERFVAGDTNARERDMSQVSDGKVEWVLRAWMLLSCAVCVWNRSVILVGCPALPFIDQGGAGIIDGRKRKNRR